MSDPENENQDESSDSVNPVPLSINYELLKTLMEEAKPLVEEFYTIYVKEISIEEQIKLINQKGLPGTISYFLENTIPPEILVLAPLQLINLAQKCVLFGYVLPEIIKRLELKDRKLSIDDLNKLWELTDDDEK